MINSAFWTNFAIGSAMFLGLCCMAAAYAQDIRIVLTGLFAIPYTPVSAISEKTSGYLESVKSWALQQLSEESEKKDEGPLYFIIGSIFYSVLTVIFVLCDYSMVALTLEAMGLEAGGFKPPVDASSLAAATLVTTALFWGAVFFDLLGVTRLAPWRKSLSTLNRRLLMALSALFILLSIFIGVSMAYWRGVSVVELEMVEEDAIYSEADSFQTEGLTTDGENGLTLGNESPVMVFEDPLPSLAATVNWVILASLMGISGLSLASTALSMIGVVILAKFMLLSAVCFCALGLLPVVFVSWLLSTMINSILNWVVNILDFFINIGSSFMQLFGWNPDRALVRNGKPQEQPGPQPEAPDEETEQAQQDATVDDQSGDFGFNPFERRRA